MLQQYAPRPQSPPPRSKNSTGSAEEDINKKPQFVVTAFAELIFAFCDAYTLSQCGVVCRAWWWKAHEHSLWRVLAERRALVRADHRAAEKLEQAESKRQLAAFHVQQKRVQEREQRRAVEAAAAAAAAAAQEEEERETALGEVPPPRRPRGETVAGTSNTNRNAASPAVATTTPVAEGPSSQQALETTHINETAQDRRDNSTDSDRDESVASFDDVDLDFQSMTVMELKFYALHGVLPLAIQDQLMSRYSRVGPRSSSSLSHSSSSFALHGNTGSAAGGFYATTAYHHQSQQSLYSQRPGPSGASHVTNASQRSTLVDSLTTGVIAPNSGSVDKTLSVPASQVRQRSHAGSVSHGSPSMGPTEDHLSLMLPPQPPSTETEARRQTTVSSTNGATPVAVHPALLGCGPDGYFPLRTRIRPRSGSSAASVGDDVVGEIVHYPQPFASSEMQRVQDVLRTVQRYNEDPHAEKHRRALEEARRREEEHRANVEREKKKLFQTDVKDSPHKVPGTFSKGLAIPFERKTAAPAVPIGGAFGPRGPSIVDATTAAPVAANQANVLDKRFGYKLATTKELLIEKVRLLASTLETKDAPAVEKVEADIEQNGLFFGVLRHCAPPEALVDVSRDCVKLEDWLITLEPALVRSLLRYVSEELLSAAAAHVTGGDGSNDAAVVNARAASRALTQQTSGLTSFAHLQLFLEMTPSSQAFLGLGTSAALLARGLLERTWGMIRRSLPVNDDYYQLRDECFQWGRCWSVEQSLIDKRQLVEGFAKSLRLQIFGDARELDPESQTETSTDSHEDSAEEGDSESLAEEKVPSTASVPSTPSGALKQEQDATSTRHARPTIGASAVPRARLVHHAKRIAAAYEANQYRVLPFQVVAEILDIPAMSKVVSTTIYTV